MGSSLERSWRDRRINRGTRGMSVSSRVPAGGKPASAGIPSTPEPVARDAAGLLLARLTVAPTLLATAFLLASFPLLLIGWFRPAPVIIVTVIVAAFLVPGGLSRVTGLGPPHDAWTR